MDIISIFSCSLAIGFLSGCMFTAWRFNKAFDEVMGKEK